MFLPRFLAFAGSMLGLVAIAMIVPRAQSVPLPKESPTLALKFAGEMKIDDQTIDSAAIIDEGAVVVVGANRDADEAREPDKPEPKGAILDLTKKTQKPFTNGHTRRIWSVSVSGTRIATVSNYLDPVLRIWDWKANKSVAEIEIEKPEDSAVRYRVASFHKDDRIAIAANNRVIVLDPAKPDARTEHSSPDDCKWLGSVVVSPDDTRIAGIGFDGLVAVWKVGTDKATSFSIIPNNPEEEESWSAHGLCFGPKGTLLVTRIGGQFDEVPKGRKEKDVPADRRGVVRIDLENQKVIPSKMGHTSNTCTCAIDPSGTWLATGGFSHPDKPLRNGHLVAGELRVYHLATGTLVYRDQMEYGPVDWVAFTPSGKRIVAATADGNVRWWDVEKK